MGMFHFIVKISDLNIVHDCYNHAPAYCISLSAKNAKKLYIGLTLNLPCIGKVLIFSNS